MKNHTGKAFRTCSLSDCDGKMKAKGLCWKHYQRQRRTSSVHLEYINKNKPCSIPDCTEQAITRSMCAKHYSRYMIKNGDVSDPNIPSTKGKTCVIHTCQEPVRCKSLCNNHYGNFVYYKSKHMVETVEQYIAIKNNEKQSV